MSDSNSVESKRVLLTILQARITAHGTRMWQMPLTFMGGITLAIASLSKGGIEIPPKQLFGLLSFLGVVLSWALWGAAEGYIRTGKDLLALEKELGLKGTTRTPWSHILPYAGIMILGVLVCVSWTFNESLVYSVEFDEVLLLTNFIAGLV